MMWGRHVACIGEVNTKVSLLSETSNLRYQFGRPLTTVPVSTAAPTATKFPVSLASGLQGEG